MQQSPKTKPQTLYLYTKQQHDSKRTLAHRLLDARHRAPDVLAERLLPKQLHHPRRLEQRAGPRFQVRNVQPDAAALQYEIVSDVYVSAASFLSRLGQPGCEETCRQGARARTLYVSTVS